MEKGKEIRKEVEGIREGGGSEERIKEVERIKEIREGGGSEEEMKGGGSEEQFMDKPCWGFPPIYRRREGPGLGLSIFKKQ